MMLHRNIRARAAQKAALAKAVKPERQDKPQDKKPEKKPVAKPAYTRDEIEKFPFLKLKSIAVKNGLDVTDKKASEIREELLKKMGL